MTAPLNGRVTVYTNQVPYEADVLRSNTYKMADVSKLAETVLGTGISNAKLVSGLPCLPIAPPGLQVTVGSGCLYSFESYDATAYSVLPADNDPHHRLYKQALNFDLVTLNTPAPSVVGNSIIYLVQAAFETLDVNIISRPYFNSADPTSPIFNSLSDTRTDKILINVKSGVEAPSPVAPTPDAGFIGLYYVTVAFGQTSIVTNNITVATGAPFVTESLTQKISYNSIRTNQYTIYTATGTANALIVTPNPSYPALISGVEIKIISSIVNTGSSTLSIDGGITSYPIYIQTPAGKFLLKGGEISGIHDYIFDGVEFILLNPSLSRVFISSVYMGTNQVVPALTAVLLNFDTVDVDDYSWFTSSTKSILPTIPGWYEINALNLTNGNSGNSYAIYLNKNGVNIADMGQIQGANNDQSLSSTRKILLNGVSDVISIHASNSAGTSVTFFSGNLSSSFQVKYIGF